MINKIWIYIGATLGSAIFIFLCMLFYNAIYNYFLYRKLKKNIPSDLKKDAADAGKESTLSEKEVYDDERRKIDKFRQFEQLRYIAERERGTSSRESTIERIRAGINNAERSQIQNHSVEDNNRAVELN